MATERAKRNSFKWTVQHGRAVKLRAPVFVCEGVTGTETFDLGKLSDTMLQTWFESASARSKLHDAAALPAGTPEREKFAAMRGVYETLVSGEWNPKRETLTPEQRAAILAERVSAAWVSLDTENRSAAKFAETVAARVEQLRALGNSGANADVVIAALSKNAKIIAAMAKLSGGDMAEVLGEMEI